MKLIRKLQNDLYLACNTRAKKENLLFKKEHGDDFFMVSWLEHRVRTICGARRPLDKHFVPYERSGIRSNSGNASDGACSGSDDD